MFVLVTCGHPLQSWMPAGKTALKIFANKHGHRIAGWYIDNRPELIRLLGDAEPSNVILIEQVDRLIRLDDLGRETLRKRIDEQQSIVSQLATWR